MRRGCPPRGRGARRSGMWRHSNASACPFRAEGATGARMTHRSPARRHPPSHPPHPYSVLLSRAQQSKTCWTRFARKCGTRPGTAGHQNAATAAEGPHDGVARASGHRGSRGPVPGARLSGGAARRTALGGGSRPPGGAGPGRGRPLGRAGPWAEPAPGPTRFGAPSRRQLPPSRRTARAPGRRRRRQPAPVPPSGTPPRRAPPRRRSPDPRRVSGAS
jgi:hypothetical protein